MPATNIVPVVVRHRSLLGGSGDVIVSQSSLEEVIHTITQLQTNCLLDNT